SVSDVVWHPSGEMLAIAYIQGEVSILAYPSQEEIFRITDLRTNRENGFFQIEWSHDGDFLAVPNGNGVTIYDTSTWDISQTIVLFNPITGETESFHNILIVDIAWSEDDNLLATLSYNGSPF